MYRHPTSVQSAAASRVRIAALAVLAACVLAAAVSAAPALAAEQHPYNEGCKALAVGDVDKAIKLFAEAVKLDPKDTDALNNLAVCYIESEQYSKALPLLEKVLALNAKYRGADLNIGAGYILQDQPDKATPPTTKAKDSPATANGKTVEAAAYYNLGLIDAQAGRYAKAQEEFEQSAKVKPSVATDVALAGVLLAQGEYDAAVKNLKDAAAKAGDELKATVKTDLAIAYYRRGMDRLEAKDFTGADDDFTASNGQEQNDFAKMGAALVAAERGDYDEATDVLTELKDSGSTAALKAAAAENLTRVEDLSGGTTGGWVSSLVVFGGGVLFALQVFVVLRAAARRRRGAAAAMVFVAAAVGVLTAAVFALTFFGVLDSQVLVLGALAVDVVVIVLTLVLSSAGARGQTRPA